MRPLINRFASVAVAVALALVSAQPALAADTAPVILAVPALSFSFTMEYLAQDLGLFAKQGVTVKEVNITGPRRDQFADLRQLRFRRGVGRLAHPRRRARPAPPRDRRALEPAVRASSCMRKTIAETAGFDPHAPLAKRAQVLKGHIIAVEFDQRRRRTPISASSRIAGGIDPESIQIAVMAPPSMPAAFATKQIDGFAMTPPWPQKPLLDGTAVLVASGPDGDPAEPRPVRQHRCC